MIRLEQINAIHRTHLNSSVSVVNSCSIWVNTWTISLIIIGQSEVTWCEDIRRSRTRKHKKTWAWTEGTTWGNLKLSESRSKKNLIKLFEFFLPQNFVFCYCRSVITPALRFFLTKTHLGYLAWIYDTDQFRYRK